MARAKSAGIRLREEDAPIARGMLARGDRVQDVAAYFGVNPARFYKELDEFGSGIAPDQELPQPGPYIVRDLLSQLNLQSAC